ncbi:hypothetical protein EK904_014327 [Melospiza melodia maxima]|nr:hypothetical protein EK904_014327 [Melospiza melodia maxima]
MVCSDETVHTVDGDMDHPSRFQRDSRNKGLTRCCMQKGGAPTFSSPWADVQSFYPSSCAHWLCFCPGLSAGGLCDTTNGAAVSGDTGSLLMAPTAPRAELTWQNPSCALPRPDPGAASCCWGSGLVDTHHVLTLKPSFKDKVLEQGVMLKLLDMGIKWRHGGNGTPMGRLSSKLNVFESKASQTQVVYIPSAGKGERKAFLKADSSHPDCLMQKVTNLMVVFAHLQIQHCLIHQTVTYPHCKYDVMEMCKTSTLNLGFSHFTFSWRFDEFYENLSARGICTWLDSAVLLTKIPDLQELLCSASLDYTGSAERDARAQDHDIICVNAVCWVLKLLRYLQKTKERRAEQMHQIHRCILIYDILMKDLVVRFQELPQRAVPALAAATMLLGVKGQSPADSGVSSWPLLKGKTEYIKVYWLHVEINNLSVKIPVCIHSQGMSTRQRVKWGTETVASAEVSQAPVYCGHISFSVISVFQGPLRLDALCKLNIRSGDAVLGLCNTRPHRPVRISINASILSAWAASQMNAARLLELSAQWVRAFKITFLLTEEATRSQLNATMLILSPVCYRYHPLLGHAPACSLKFRFTPAASIVLHPVNCTEEKCHNRHMPAVPSNPANYCFPTWKCVSHGCIPKRFLLIWFFGSHKIQLLFCYLMASEPVKGLWPRAHPHRARKIRSVSSQGAACLPSPASEHVSGNSRHTYHSLIFWIRDRNSYLCFKILALCQIPGYLKLSLEDISKQGLRYPEGTLEGIQAPEHKIVTTELTITVFMKGFYGRQLFAFSNNGLVQERKNEATLVLSASAVKSEGPGDLGHHLFPLPFSRFSRRFHDLQNVLRMFCGCLKMFYVSWCPAPLQSKANGD